MNYFYPCLKGKKGSVSLRNKVLFRKGLCGKLLFTMLIACFLIPLGSNAQTTCPVDPMPADQLDARDLISGQGDCTSKDLEVLDAFLQGGDLCTTCQPGDIQTLNLMLVIRNNTGSTRTSTGIFADITDGTNNCTIARCSGPIAPNSEEAYSFGTLNYECGSVLTLTNILGVWTDASPNSVCPLNSGIKPKCGFSDDDIVIRPPLQCPDGDNIVIDSPCEGELDGSITISGVGGNAPYTYILNGTTSNTTGVFDNLGIGTYNIKVTDADGCQVDCSYTVEEEICCVPELACPSSPINANTDDGQCYATISISDPTATICTGQSLQIDGKPANNQYPIGSTIITYSIVDNGGAVVTGLTCTVEVIVSDNEAPSINCLNLYVQVFNKKK